MEHGRRRWRTGISLGRPCVERKERDEDSESDEQQQIDPVAIQKQSGFRHADDRPEVERPHTLGLDEIETDQPQEENKAAEGEVDRGFPSRRLPVARAPDSDQQKRRDEGQLMEHVEEKEIDRGERPDAARRDEQERGVEPVGVFFRRAGHRHRGDRHERGQQQHDQAQPVGSQRERDPHRGNHWHRGNELVRSLPGLVNREEREHENQVGDRRDERGGPGIRADQDEGDRHQRNENQKKERAGHGHLKIKM